MDSPCKQTDYKEEDVPALVEALAEVTHKWEEIAVALRLPEAVSEECREGRSFALKLKNVLYTWVVGQHSNARPATLENLKKALASPLVQHPQLAGELEDKLKTSLSLPTVTSTQKSVQSTVKEVLVEKYSQSPEVPRGSSWPPVVSKKFINLSLIETSDQPLKSDYSIRGDANEVLSKKKVVQYEVLFSKYMYKRRNVLIFGRPGSGKTTLVHKLVRDWSVGEALQGAELVFLVSLRNIHSDKTLSDILQTLIFDENYLKQVSTAIEQVEGDRVYFIFDGFDEYCPQNKRESVIYALLNKSYLVNAMIIVTSRPAAASAEFQNYFIKVEVFGFGNDQIMEYIDNYPFSFSEGSRSKTFIESYPRLLDLCYLPVNCAIICFIYNSETDQLPDTWTQIYALFTRLIIFRQLTKKDNEFRELNSIEDLRGQEAKDFKYMCSLAFDMTTDSKQVRPRGSMNISDEARSLGLVTIDITATLCGYVNSYSFLHLTLQEFLAAYHLSKLNQEEQLSHIEKYGKTVHMLTVWKFYCGLVNFQTGMNRAEKLFSNVHIIDSSNEKHWFKVHSTYEAKQDVISQLASSECFCLPGIQSSYDMSAIAYTMSMAATSGQQATPTTSLVFDLWSSGDNLLKVFINELSDQALNYLENWQIYYVNNVCYTDMEALAGKLNTRDQIQTKGLTHLEYLMVSGNMGDESIRALAAGLDGNLVLKSLDLSNYLFLETLHTPNIISAPCISELMKAHCSLSFLDLSGHCIGNEGAIAIARGLRGNDTLTHIILSSNMISVTGIEALASVTDKDLCLYMTRSDKSVAVPSNPASSEAGSTLLQDYYHSPTRDQTETERAVIQDLKDCRMQDRCNLSLLELCNNHCGPDLAAILSKFKSLDFLDLSGNFGHNLKGAMDVINYIANSENCQQLKYLRLSPTIYKPESMSHVDYLLSQSFSGCTVDLSHSNMDKESAVLVLQAIKDYDRFSAVYLEHNDISANEDTIDDLKKAFQHGQIDRFIYLDSQDLCFEVPACQHPKKRRKTKSFN